MSTAIAAPTLHRCWFGQRVGDLVEPGVDVAVRGVSSSDHHAEADIAWVRN